VGIIGLVLSLLGFAGNVKDDSWILAQGKDGDYPLIMRARSGIPSGINSKEYKCLVTIIWNYLPDENGFPNSKENEAMDKLEAAIDTLIEKNKFGYTTHIFTCNGRREWNLYTKEKNKFVSAFNEYLSKNPKAPIQIDEAEDPNWDEWRSVLSMAKKK
jgi:hypothetical protein